ncbi:MAG: hypothetical protein IJK58_02585 [Clostridia bacterium]|nr:hypothetical protein [Clostridia bacterium]
MKKEAKRALAAAALILSLAACARRPEGDAASREPTGEVCTETDAPHAVPQGGKFTVVRSGGERRDSLERAIRLRDMAAKERTGVTVVYADAADDGAAEIAAAADCLSGDHGFGAAEGSFSRLCAPLLAKGVLRAAEEFGGALGEASLNPTLKTKNGTFFITGAIVPASLGDVSCIAVNLETARRFNVRVPDAGTLSGRFGWDALTASAALVPDGVGIYRYGSIDRSLGAAILLSSGNGVTKEEDGVPGIAAIAGEAKKILGRAAAAFGDGAVCFRPDAAIPEGERGAAVRSAFSDPGILYLFCKTGDIPSLREAGDEISVVPYPGEKSAADSVRGTAGVILRGGGATAPVLSALEETSLKYTYPEAIDAYLSGRTQYDSASRGALLSVLSGAIYEPSFALAGAGGEELNEMLSAAAEGEADALVGWELKAAIANLEIEKILGE